jgi:hypothetical protein
LEVCSATPGANEGEGPLPAIPATRLGTIVSASAKRLPVLLPVARRLYFLSGNQCAFPSCKAPLIDDKGNWIAETCHIEAASPKGPRFNRKMTDQDRRAFENLILLCHPHHVLTHDETAYSVEGLRRMKAEHEKKYEQAAKRIMESALTDLTDDVPRQYPRNLQRWRDGTSANLSDTELLASIPELKVLIDRLASLPTRARSILGLLIKRGTPGSSGIFEIRVHELQSVIGGDEQLAGDIEILEKYKFAYLDHDEYRPITLMTYPEMKSGWEFWSDLRHFCEEIGESVDAIVAEMRFEILDDPG